MSGMWEGFPHISTRYGIVVFPRVEGYKLSFDVFRPICLHIGGLGKLTKQVKVYIVDVTGVNIWLGSYTLGVVLRLVVPLV